MKKRKKIFSKSMKVIFRFVEMVLAFIIVVGGITLTRLYTHPIEIKEYLPTLEKYILPDNSGLSLKAESLTLSAAFKENGILHINIKEMQVLHSNGDSAIQLPSVTLSYDLWQILKLNYIPNNISVSDASLYVTITKEGAFYLYGDKKTENQETLQKNKIPVVIDKDGPTPIRTIIRHILSFDAVSLENCDLNIQDNEKNETLNLTKTNILLEKQDKVNYALKVKSILNIQNHLTKLELHAQMNRFSRKMSFDIEFDKLYLKNIARIIPVLKEADITIDGHIKGIFDFGHKCQDIISCFKEGAFHFTSSKGGTLNLPSPLANLYHIKEMTINGALGEHLEKIKIARSVIKLKDGPTAELELDVSGIGSFLTDGKLEDVKTTLKSHISSLPIEQAPAVWPPETGPDAHAWVSKNLSQGKIEKADFTLYFTGGELVDLYGEIPVKGIHVRYLDDMTPVRDFNGLVKLWPNRVLITGNSAKVMDINLKQATIDLTDLDKDLSRAKIALSVEGPVQNAMQLISEKPLEFAQMFGLDPNKTGGEATVNVDLNFPLIDDLTTSQVQVNVLADIKNAVFPTPMNNQNLTQGELELSVNNSRLLLAGTAKIDEIPLELKWEESFTTQKGTDTQSKYMLKSRFETALLKNLWPDAHDYVDGEISLNGEIIRKQNGITDGKFDFDLSASELFFIPISTQKDKDIPATLSLTFNNNKEVTTLNYDLKTSVDEKALNPIIIRGDIILNGDTKQVNLTEVLAPKTNFNGSIELNQKGITGKITGKSWDLSALYHSPDDMENQQNNKSTPFISPKNMDIEIKLDRLILNEEEPITNLLGHFKKQNGIWQKLSLNAIAGVPFNVAYQPKKQTLMATTTDFGAFLNHIGLPNRIEKGDFSLNMTQQEIGGFKGEINIKKFKLKDTSFWMQAVTILGIIDGIRGKDLSFEEAKIPFTIEHKPILTFSVKEGLMSGTNLGITFNGTTTSSEINMSGSIITAYAINSLPGKIPFIGALFKDGEGGGLFGVKYDLTGSPFKPEINFNTLSSIAPGILGTLFK